MKTEYHEVVCIKNYDNFKVGHTYDSNSYEPSEISYYYVYYDREIGLVEAKLFELYEFEQYFVTIQKYRNTKIDKILE